VATLVLTAWLGKLLKTTFSFVLALFIWIHSILPGLGVVELVKLPALFQHYQKHRQLNTELSLLRFWEMHYADKSHHSQDHKEHHKLPFTDHQTPISLASIYFEGYRSGHLTVNLFHIGQANQSIYHSIVEEDITVMVWQPPRI
jgi:hypothetical protein